MQKTSDFFEIVAHRGIATEAPENTLASFERAVELGADGVEMDVRLTTDKEPVVYHYYYLETNTSGSGAVFNHTLDQLRELKVFCKTDPGVPAGGISTLPEILDAIGGRIGIEIHMQGPEPEAPAIIGKALLNYKQLWDSIEVTCYEPALLHTIQKICPGLAVDFLYPRTESWMKLDVVKYQALHGSRLAHARAVHLHPTQLSNEVVTGIRQAGFEVHAWEVNDIESLDVVTHYKIPRICSDNFRLALAYRERMATGQK